METKIKESIDNPEQLEKLYRADKKNFEKSFFCIYPEIADSKIADFWKVRLEFDARSEAKSGTRKTDVYFLIITCFVTGFLIKIPQIFNVELNDYFFYEKNAGLILFLGLSAYTFLTKMQINYKHQITSIIVFGLSAIYINLLPSNRDSDSINLAYLHLPLFLWCFYGLIFIDFDIKDKTKRIDYIKYNGDIAILTAIILVAGGILTVITIGLFSAIDLNIEEFYFENIVIIGAVSSPIVATYIVKNFPSVTNKLAPIIATIFSPLVLITLIIYLITVVNTGKDPYNDRDFLVVFNIMLLGVMGIIVFSVSEASENRRRSFNELTLFILSIVTLIIDLIALSAILYRLGEFGFTPNRTAVLGSNLLIFGHLVLIMLDLYKVGFKENDIKTVELTISKYLPVYAVWTIFVTFVLPFIFELK
ncbi:hypothetical protein [Thermophagus xiamenensis]|uniref:DUF4153 domain-containing protein n=1 Tax=Thermophagus xiamenensis TaxID=385682 RepID=A0A1I2A0G9_9BACT|nr:hypothetical protein [Thermophagus xiamenensis]SFE37462.1 hypothetical protein SAMN05444380_11081 [Thermophagus xiamenensis]